MTVDRDVVVVGAGVVGVCIAAALARAGRAVTLLEAGSFTGLDVAGYGSFVDRFHAATIRAPNSPYPAFVPSPSVVERDTGGGYFAQRGPVPFGSDYLREGGGSTLHWLGSTPRLLANDLRMSTAYGVGVDWPLDADALMPWWEAAEAMLGVSGDAEVLARAGYPMRPGWTLPMRAIPLSRTDRFFAEGLSGKEVDGVGPRVVHTPSARNGEPVVGRPNTDALRTGERCQGYASCVPICPIGARYSALRTLAALGDAVERRPHVLVRRLVAAEDGRVLAMEGSSTDPAAPGPLRVRPRLVVLAANAIENAKLLLASGLARSSGKLGRGLMDHPYLLAVALAPTSVRPWRGPGSTAGIEGWADGPERARRAAFRVEIGNWGWDHATFSPGSDVDAGLAAGLRGPALRAWLADRLPRQVRLGFLLEQLPDDSNRVEVDPACTTDDGELRPVLHYGYDAYVRAGAAAAARAASAIFRACGAEEHPVGAPGSPGWVESESGGAKLWGAGHLGGTHRMSASPNSGVVDPNQRAFDHPNLYVVGCGSMPTMGTANPTLTAVALALRTADAITRECA